MKMNESVNALLTREKPATGKRLCLWMADDHESILSMLVDVLGRSGQIQCARLFDSAEALLQALASETPPDAILMDVNMGGMTGVEAIAPIKCLAGSMRVFIMTTFFDGTAMSSAQQAGAAGFFLKTGDWDDAIRRILDPASDWKAGTPAPIAVCEPIFEEEPLTTNCGEQNCTSSAQVHEKSDAAVRELPTPWLGRVAAAFRPYFGRSSLRQPPVPQ
jgi:CheY-like chemotaxis protein